MWKNLSSRRAVLTTPMAAIPTVTVTVMGTGMTMVTITTMAEA